MLEKEIREKIVKIMELSLKKTARNKNTIFVKFSGHSECLEIDIYKKGWQPKKADFNKIWFLCNHTTEENIEMLDKIIKKIEELK